MHREHAPAVHVNDGWILQQAATAVGAKTLAEEKITIAVHDVARYPRRGQSTQTGDHTALLRVGIVIADPHLEQVAENVECLGLARFTAEELQELARDFRMLSVQVQIRDEQRCHRVYSSKTAF